LSFSNLAVSLIEPAHYLSSDSSTAYFSLLTQQPGTTKKQQQSYRVMSMGFVVAECHPGWDTWISQAEFWAKTRRIVHCRRVGLMFIDLDTYKIPALMDLTPERQLDKLLQVCEQQGVLPPSLVVYSGRGLQAKWVLDGALPARALPRWSLVQRELCKRLGSMGADANALDASRVLRLVHTVNSRSGEVVRVVHDTGVRLSFDQLADSLLPFTREKLREMREARAALAANEDHFRVSSVFPLAPSSNISNSWSNLRLFMGAQLAWDRLADLRMLAQLRGWNNGAPDGLRDSAVFIGACFLAQALPNTPRFYDELRTLGREFAPHWSQAEANGSASAVILRMKMHASDKTVEYKGAQTDPRYRWKNDTLIEHFGITPQEERQLRTIISSRETRRRAAERAVVRRAAHRVAVCGVTREDYESKAAARRVTARSMRAQGQSWAEVATAVGYLNADSARKACS
jgi:hypothetical protein